MLLVTLLAMQAAAVEPFAPIPPYEINDSNAGGTPHAGDRLFAAFGGHAGVTGIVDDLVVYNTTDPRISDIFKASDPVRLRRTLVEQFTYLLGGGGHYTGRDMKTAHKDMGLQNADMGALVENLQRAMRKGGVPFGAQNKLLAKLASMKRMMIER